MENDVMIRLDKYISENYPCARSEAKKIIVSGKVSVDGIVIKKPESKIDEASEVVCLGKTLKLNKGLYYMLNKPAGYISAVRDDKQKTVTDLFPPEIAGKIFPVGRLDKDTEGLLLMTDDGDFCHRIESPKKGVVKTYYARTEGKISADARERFKSGIEFSDFTSKPAEIEILSEEGANCEVRVKVSEGKFHQVKKMLHAVGAEVVYLKRISVGGLALDEGLASGEYRELSEEEIKLLIEEH